MEKIIIVCGPEGPDDTLLSWIETAFPECAIEVRTPEPGRRRGDSFHENGLTEEAPGLGFGTLG